MAEEKKRWRSDATKRELLKALSEFRELILFDTETTGLNHKQDRIIEIAATKYLFGEDKRLKEIDHLHEYIRPPFNISDEISELTGITNEQLAVCEDEATVFERISRFFSKTPSIVVAYNTPFDMRFLRALYERITGEAIAPIYELDVLEMARDLVSPAKIESHKLSTVSRYFGLASDSTRFHSAVVDVKAIAQLFEIFYKKYLELDSISKSARRIIKPAICSVCFWPGYRGESRIYVQTDVGSVYFDLRKKSWYGKDVDIDTLNMAWIEKEAMRLTCSFNLTQFANFIGRVRAD